MPESLKTTPLFEEHKRQGAKMTVFHGWKMPLEFQGGRAEHLAVRKTAGLFDISHMGKIRVQGGGALQGLQRLLTNEACRLKKNQAQYTLLCNEEGGIEDDLILYCFQEGTDYLLCVNGSRVEWDLKWIKSRLSKKEGEVRDESSHWGLVALQGPLSPQILSTVLNQPELLNLKRFRFQPCGFEGGKVIVCATGYTGEKGFEIFVPWGQTLSFWRKIMTSPGLPPPTPSGLGARDTLRIEMKYPLYGQDLNAKTDPYSVGLEGVVKNTAHFTGQKALALLKSRIKTKWVGFSTMEKRGVPRPGAGVFLKGQSVGTVSSGAFSPCLNKMIGMAHIQKHLSQVGRGLEVSIHGELVPVKVVDTPFINR